MADPVTPPPSPAATPAPFQNVTLRINLGDLVQVSVISKTERPFTTECVNLSEEDQSVLCPVPNANLRGNYTVLSASYPYTNLQLANKITKIYLDQVATYTITKSDLGISTQTNSTAQPTLPAGNNTLSASDQQQIDDAARERSAEADRDPEISINVHALWSLNQNTLSSLSLVSSQIPNLDRVVFTLAGQSCLRLEVTDMVYKLSLVYNGTTTVTADSGGNMVSLAQVLTSNSTEITNAAGVVSFRSSTTIVANLVIPRVTNIVPVDCVVQTSPAPTPPPQLTSGLARYGIVTNANTTQNSIGKYYGFSDTRVNTVFNYDHIDKYAVLVKADNCFKVKIWIVIPAFFVVIVFPLWIDAKILTSILGGLQTALGAAAGVLTQALSVARDLRSQVSVKNYLAFYQKQLAIAKALTTEDGIIKLATTVQRIAERGLERIQEVADLEKLLKAVEAIWKLIQTAQELLDSLSSTNFRGFSDPSSLANIQTLKEFAEPAKAITNTMNKALETLIELVDLLPDMIIKQRIQETIRDVKEFAELLKTLVTKEFINAPIPTSPLEASTKMIEVLFDREAIRKAYKIHKDLSLMQNAYDLLLEEFKNAASKVLQEGQNVTMEAINTANTLADIGEEQDKTALEQAVTELAEDAAAEIDNMIGSVADALQFNQLENLANAGLDLAVSGVSAAADALGSAAEGVESRKRDEIRSVLAAHLMLYLDIYKISRLGKFDENNPTERQILVNDLAGTRIYSADGNTLLFERKDFCKHPFVDLANTRLNSNGCQAGTNPCDVGGFNCQEKNYWYSAFQYRISFDFYDNHDLSKGGVVIGDFDGDGVDDIMCHLPGTTKKYNDITKDYNNRAANDKSDIVINNEIIYAPLKSLTSNGRFQSKEQPMLVYNATGTPQSQKDWCKDGVIRVGDFNGDKKDDMLCLTATNNYLLYSNGFTFRPASNSTDGRISLPNINSNSVVVVGDFDGDSYSDILAMSSTNLVISYGHQDLVFVQNATKTNSWVTSYQAQLTACYNVGINRIIIADVNNDGKDDVSCVLADNSNVNTIHSTVTGTINPTSLPQSKPHVRIYIDDIQLSPYTDEQGNNAQQNIRLNHQTHKNIFGADAVLISHDHMLPQQKSVSDVSMALNCLSFTNITSEVHMSFSGEYIVPETLLWKQGNAEKNLIVNIDVSAEFQGNTLINLVSSKVQSYKYKLEAYQGGCYNSESASHYTTTIIGYSGIAKIVIERDGILLQGRDLEIEAKKILPSFDIENESIISSHIDGQMTVNILGVGYDSINHCD